MSLETTVNPLPAERGASASAPAVAPTVASGPPARVVETARSVLVFLGDRVFKVKKPVDLGAMDFRGRQARLAACEAEVRLNRRLAPDVYLGVADVIGPDGEPCDHMVVMRRLPEARRLSTLAEGGTEVRAEIHALTRVLVDFHARCETSSRIAEAGGLDRLRGRWDACFARVQRDHGAAVSASILDHVNRLAVRYLDGRDELLRERREAGRIRDGHGDLSAADIFCLDDGPRVLDCLEFEPGLRAADVLADACALAADLEWLGRRDLARLFLDHYREMAGETHPRSLEDFYWALAALGRCQAACQRVAAGENAAAEARAFADLALARLRWGRVRLVLVGGQRGTGKSTLAGGLAGTERWTVLRFDDAAADLAASANRHDLAAGGWADAGGWVPADDVDAVHQELLRQAGTALRRGESVVVDAPWNRHSQRAQAADVARRAFADLVQLRCTAPPDLAATRTDRRSPATTAATSATGSVGLGRLADTVSRIEPWPEAKIIDTAVAIAESLHNARRAAA